MPPRGSVVEEIAAYNAKLLQPDHSPLNAEERANLAQALSLKSAADKARTDARHALAAPQTGSSAAAVASRQTFELELTQINDKYVVDMLAVENQCPDWQTLLARNSNYNNALEQLRRLKSLQHEEEAAATVIAAQELRLDVAAAEAIAGTADGGRGAAAAGAEATRTGAQQGDQGVQQRVQQQHQQQPQLQQQQQQQRQAGGAAAPAVTADRAAVEAARLAAALQADLPAAAPPINRDRLRPELELGQTAPAKIARTLPFGDPAVFARSASSSASNPLLQLLATDSNLADVVEKVPFMKEMASALDLHSISSNQQRFRQQAEALARDNQDQAVMLEKAAAQVDDPDLRAAMAQASAAAWRQTASVQATHLRLDKANSVLGNWKDAAQIMTKGASQEQDLVIGWANLTESQRAGLMRSIGVTPGTSGSAASGPKPQQLRAPGHNPNLLPVGGAGGIAGNCFFCNSNNHGWRTCAEFAKLRDSNALLHARLSSDYAARPGRRPA